MVESEEQKGAFEFGSGNHGYRFVVDPETMRTSRPGIFAGGDDVNGADLVVTALAHGHLAADGIHDYLTTGEWPISAPLS